MCGPHWHKGKNKRYDRSIFRKKNPFRTRVQHRTNQRDKRCVALQRQIEWRKLLEIVAPAAPNTRERGPSVGTITHVEAEERRLLPHRHTAIEGENAIVPVVNDESFPGLVTGKTPSPRPAAPGKPAFLVISCRRDTDISVAPLSWAGVVQGLADARAQLPASWGVPPRVVPKIPEHQERPQRALEDLLKEYCSESNPLLERQQPVLPPGWVWSPESSDKDMPATEWYWEGCGRGATMSTAPYARNHGNCTCGSKGCSAGPSGSSSRGPRKDDDGSEKKPKKDGDHL